MTASVSPIRRDPRDDWGICALLYSPPFAAPDLRAEAGLTVVSVSPVRLTA